MKSYFLAELFQFTSNSSCVSESNPNYHTITHLGNLNFQNFPPIALRLPCGDLTPLTEGQLDLLIISLDDLPLDWFDGRCVQGAGTYSANYSEVRLLGIPAS